MRFHNIILHISGMIAVATLLTLSGCSGFSSSRNASPASNDADSSSMVIPRHAKGFNVTYADGYILLDINDPENKEKEQFHYALVPNGKDVDTPQGYTRIETPVKSVVCMTSLQLSNFIKLGITEKVTGITSTRHLHNSSLNSQIESKTTFKIGIEGNFDNELIMAIDPDIIFISPFKRGGYDALRNTDIPLIPHLGYKELTPLGQAEWIKVTGLLTGNANRANEIFDGIEHRYDSLRHLASEVNHRPTVFSGEMRGGNWYAVGGRSFLAQMFHDAGADYFLKDNTESGGVTLDYETVYANAAHTDYWRIVNSYNGTFDYSVLESNDKRYTDFDAWKKHGVIYCNMSQVPFYESMPVEPEIVLADLLYVFHPELLPDHKPVYYRLLR